MKKNNLPVFPLGIVALPGNIQHLQIFEPRYLKMVKDCMSNGHGFVVVFQKQHSNTDDYEISKKGSYVEIIDFNSLPNGLLGITIKSINKVTIKDLTQLEDGLHIANTLPLIDPEVDDQALLAEFPELGNILSQLVQHPKISEMPLNVDFNSADSIAYNLAGLIPLSSSNKQNLLEAFDAAQRFEILSQYIDEISSN